MAGKGRCDKTECFYILRSEIISCAPTASIVFEITHQGENPSPQFWVIVPTLNPGPLAWAQWIDALKAQSCQPQKVVVVDSGSIDGSLELTQAAGFNVWHVEAQNFDHGGTRQWALMQALEMAKAQGDVAPDHVVFLTQDAILSEPQSLCQLTLAFQDPQIAAVFGKQLPKPDAPWMEQHTRAFNYSANSYKVSLADKARLGLKTCFFSNSFGAYRLQSLLSMGGFPSGLPLGEDTFTAAKLLLLGQSLQYQATAAVYHSHSYNGAQSFQRMFDTGVFHAQNNWLVQTFGKPEGEGFRLILSQWAFLKAHPHLQNKWIGALEMFFINGLKFCGYKLGTLHRFLPHALNTRLAMYKSFWQKRA